MSKLKKTGNQLKNEMVEMNKSLTNGDVLVSNVLRPKSKDGKAGFVDINDQWVINPQYDDVDVFREGVAWVKVSDKWGLIDRNGKMLINPQYDDAREFNDGVSPVKIDGHWGIVDKCGRVVANPEYDIIRPFKDGVAVIKKSGKFGFINIVDNIAIAPIYEKVHDFSDGLAAVMVNNMYGFINMAGEMVLVPEYTRVCLDFSYGTAVVLTKEGDYIVIDKEGNYVDEPYDWYEDANDWTLEDDPEMYDNAIKTYHGYLNHAGTFAIRPKFQEAGNFRNGIASVKIDNKWGIIDSTGAYLIEPQFEEICRIDEVDRVFKVTKKGQSPYCSIIDLSGKSIVDNIYTRCHPYVLDDTIEIIGDDDKFGFIDIEGNVIAEPIYNMFHDGLYPSFCDGIA